MTGPSGKGGIPPLEPPIEMLKDLASAVQNGIGSYEAASSPQDKAAALKEVQAGASKLALHTTPLPQRYLDLVYDHCSAILC